PRLIGKGPIMSPAPAHRRRRHAIVDMLLGRSTSPDRIESRSIGRRAAPRRPVVEELESRLAPAAPIVTAIIRSSPTQQQTSASPVTYSVRFDQSVTGVDATDFRVVTDGTVPSNVPISVSGSGSTYFVTVSGLRGAGNLHLNLTDNDSITANGVPLG